jgi:hypothetical protein
MSEEVKSSPEPDDIDQVAAVSRGKVDTVTPAGTVVRLAKEFSQTPHRETEQKRFEYFIDEFDDNHLHSRASLREQCSENDDFHELFKPFILIRL